MANFETGLRDYLEGKERLNANERRLLRVLDLPKNNKRRQRVLRQVELAASNKLQEDGVRLGASFDWGSIDWESLLASIMKLIQMIISLFGGL